MFKTLAQVFVILTRFTRASQANTASPKSIIGSSRKSLQVQCFLNLNFRISGSIEEVHHPTKHFKKPSEVDLTTHPCHLPNMITQDTARLSMSLPRCPQRFTTNQPLCPLKDDQDHQESIQGSLLSHQPLIL